MARTSASRMRLFAGSTVLLILLGILASTIFLSGSNLQALSSSETSEMRERGKAAHPHPPLGAPNMRDSGENGFAAPVLSSAPSVAASDGPLTNVVSVSAGGNHTCALLDGGSVKCWGYNYLGQLGDGSWQNSSYPVDVNGLPSAVAVGAGDFHSCALSVDGGVYCWGANDSGELGTGYASYSEMPVAVLGLETGLESLSVGNRHNCALFESGEVRCWGDNSFGQLGNGSFADAYEPVSIIGIPGEVLKISVGFRHSCALVDNGDIYCWGSNHQGALGDGTDESRTQPVRVQGLAGPAYDISAGGYYFAGHTCAAIEESGIQCWGYGFWGQLGDGTDETSFSPVNVTGSLSEITSMDMGWLHSCAVVGSGSVKCWGGIGLGELGTGFPDGSDTPMDVVGLGANVSSVSAGGSFGLEFWGDAQGSHTCSVLEDTTVKCWGWNQLGQLGDGTTTNSPTPVMVSAGAPTYSISGTVYNPDGSPAYGGYVNLCTAVFSPCDYLTSGFIHEDGSFTIANIWPGTYHLLADPSYEGYLAGILSEYYDNAFIKALAEDIVVSSPGTYPIPPITLNMPGQFEGTSKISGRVTSSSGDGIANIDVYFCTYPIGGEYDEICAAGVKTDSEGFYISPDLDADEYRVWFVDQTRDYVQSYYTETSEYGAKPYYKFSTTVIPTGDGLDASGIDVKLWRGARIGGTVIVEPDLSPAGSVLVQACAESGGCASNINSPVSGAYEISQLWPGNYWLEFNAEVKNLLYSSEFWEDTDWFGRDTIVLLEGDNFVADATLRRNGGIAGTVSGPNGPVSGMRVYVCVANAPSCNISFDTYTNQSGQYSIQGVPIGMWAVRFDGNSELIGEFYNDKASYKDATPVEVVGGTTTSGIDAVLAPVSAASTPTSTPFPPTSVPPTVTAAPPTATSDHPTATPVPTTKPVTPNPPTVIATVAVQPNAAATLSVGPGQGLENGQQIDVEVPVGAVDSPITLVFNVVDEPPSGSSDLKVGGLHFRITAVQNGSPLDSFTFEKPVRLTIAYRDQDVVDLNEQLLKVLFFDEASNDWSDSGVTVISRDPDNNRIVVEISHLTTFALVDPGAKAFLPSVIK